MPWNVDPKVEESWRNRKIKISKDKKPKLTERQKELIREAQEAARNPHNLHDGFSR